MIYKNPKSAVLIAWMIAAPLTASGQEAASFLKIGPGARAMSLGGACTTVADDASALYWNPAGLSGTRAELGASHAAMFGSAQYDWIGVAEPTRLGRLGASMTRLGQGSLDGRDSSGKPSGNFGATDMAVDLGWAGSMASGLQVGGSVKYIESSIAQDSARTYAADFGAIADLGKQGPGRIEIGLAALNIGPGLRFLDEQSNLPLTFSAGAAYAFPGLMFTVDFKNRLYGGYNEFGMGTEYALLPGLAFRMGYGTAASATAQAQSGIGKFGGLNGFAAGFGMRFSRYAVDYAMKPMGELGSIQQFSLGMKF